MTDPKKCIPPAAPVLTPVTESEENKLSTGAIVGIAVGGFVFLMLLVTLCLCLCCCIKLAKGRKNKDLDQIRDGEKVDLLNDEESVISIRPIEPSLDPEEKLRQEATFIATLIIDGLIDKHIEKVHIKESLNERRSRLTLKKQSEKH